MFYLVNRILYVRNLPYKITTEEIYDIFGKFGALRQVRIGINPDTKGTAYVVYEVSQQFRIFHWQKLIRISTTLKMLVIIFLDSMYVIDILLYCTTIQLAHSRNWKLKRKKKSSSKLENEWDSISELPMNLLLFLD